MRKALLAVALTTLVVQSTAFAQTSDPITYRLTGTRIAVAQDVHIERDEEVSEAVIVIGGNLRVDGRVRDGIFVAGGDLHLSSSSDVRGEIVIVGGQITREAGARQVGSVNYVSLGDWSRRTFGWFPSIRFGEFGRWVSLFGTIARISILIVLMALLLLIARAPVARTGRAAAAEPLRALLIGLAAEIFFLPALIAAAVGLAITIIGIPFIFLLLPIAVVLLVFAFVLGFTALACRLGEWVEDRLGWQPANAFIATAMGLMILLTPTFLARLLVFANWGAEPLSLALVIAGLTIEFVVWTMGLGAAIMTGLGRWYTAPPPIAAHPTAPSPFDPVTTNL